MKSIFKILSLICIFTYIPSCSNYLDVVPDNTMQLGDIFEKREEAWDALAKVYNYMPREDDTHQSSWLLGDEYLGRLDLDGNDGNLRAIRIMRGLQTKEKDKSLLGLWSGSAGSKPLYQGIREADVFLANIDVVRDMTEVEIKNWKAQVKFLKGYYMFLLIQKYGPIVIPEKLVTPEATNEELFLPRQKVDVCFDKVLDLFEEAIPDLAERASSLNLGQVDQVAAKAIKARVLFFRASPFFNGNKEFFGDFYDHDGEPFFPLEYKKEKWDDALTAINESIELCHQNGIDLFEYEKEPYIYDREDIAANPDNMKILYDLRMVICDPWNKEVVWGYSNLNYYGQGEIAHSTNMRLPEGYGDGTVNTPEYSWQWLGATYQVAERYYTKNGLPLDEDLTVDMSKIHDLTTTPGAMDPEYSTTRGYLQPGSETINMYMNREPRFYANLGITGGYWRAHTVKIKSMFYGNSDGGYNSSQHSTDFYPAGIGIQKLVHPESQSGAWQRTIKFPYPLVRMADLYLMRSEILNEIKDAPDSEVYADINKIRVRAGIPKVETVWADASLAKTVNLHKTKEGMRDIILRERSIELSFEGSRFLDMLRHKKAATEFSAPITGWTHTGTSGKSFFTLGMKQMRKFSITDCLWPLSLDETNTNGRLIQNPGW